MPGPHDEPPHDHSPHEHHEPGTEPPGADWIENERRRRSLDDIGKLLKSFGQELGEGGVTSIRDTEIAPPEECTFTARYERTPEGDMQILYEIRWDPSTGPTRSGTADDPFSDKIGPTSNESDE